MMSHENRKPTKDEEWESEFHRDVLKYPVFRFMCPEKTEEEFIGMRTVVTGTLFTKELSLA